MGDRKTVEQQVQDPRTIEYTDKNQVRKISLEQNSCKIWGDGDGLLGYPC